MVGFLTALPGAAAQGIIWGIMAIGVYITFRVLDLADLTVDGTMGTGGAVLVMCTLGGMDIKMAMLMAVLAGCLAGLATGIFHTVFGLFLFVQKKEDKKRYIFFVFFFFRSLSLVFQLVHSYRYQC